MQLATQRRGNRGRCSRRGSPGGGKVKFGGSFGQLNRQEVHKRWRSNQTIWVRGRGGILLPSRLRTRELDPAVRFVLGHRCPVKRTSRRPCTAMPMFPIVQTR